MRGQSASSREPKGTSGHRVDRASGLSSPTLAAVVAGGVAAAWLDASAFAGYLAAALAACTLAELNGFPPGVRIAAALAAVGSPFLILEGGDDGLLWSAAVTFVLLALASIAGGVRRRVVPLLAQAVLAVLYLSLLGSHLVLIRQFPAGNRMVTAVLLMSAAYVGFSVLVERRLDPRGAAPKRVAWRAAAAGLAATEAVAFAARWLIDLPIGSTGIVILGLVVALAAAAGRAIGALSGSFARSQRHGEQEAVGHLNAGLLAVPAFYYGFRLYLS